MQAITVAGKLNWAGWLSGIVGAFVSGGADAIGGATGATMLDPAKFNLNDGLGITLKLMGVAFLISGIVSLAKFLQTSPVPQYEQLQAAEASGFSKGVDAVATAAKSTDPTK